MIIMMAGYTATGKSSIAGYLARTLDADIFHSAVIRRELGLQPGKEEVDDFFDYRKGKRDEVDRKVYAELALRAERSVKNGRHVIIDAGNFFRWQRENIYRIANAHDQDVVIVKAVCDDEEVIRKRLKRREEEYHRSPLNETPSWKTYEATKIVTEPCEEDDYNVGIIDYDTLNGKIRTVMDPASEDIKTSLENMGKFVVGLDFDGVITDPYPKKAELLRKKGHDIKDEETGYETAVRTLGIAEEDYRAAVREAYTQPADSLPLVPDCIEGLEKLKELGCGICIITARPDDMKDHLTKVLDHHNIHVDEIVNTRNENKSRALKLRNCSVFVDDQPYSINRIIFDSPDISCTLILLENKFNLQEPAVDERAIKAHDWKEVSKLIKEAYTKYKKDKPERTG